MRIKIELPAKMMFSCEIPLRITDINYGGHLGNDAVLSIMHESRVLFLKNLGYEELKMAGAALIMADSAIIYKSEGFYPETMVVEIGAADFTRSGFDLVYKITAKSTGKEIAIAKTGLLCFDYQTRKIVSIPAEVREKMESGR
jgi:acyl-CoA thioester hydrolase